MINILSRLFVGLLLFTSLFANAQAFGPQLTYHGRILDTNGGTNVPVNGNVTFLLQIVHPDVPTCVLYQETQSQNLTATDGNFTLAVNGSAAVTPVATTFADVWITDPARSINCINGGTANGSTNSRRLNVYFIPPGGGTAYEPLPSQTINYVPLAIEALNTNSVGGFGATSLLRVVDASVLPAVPWAVPAITKELYGELDATIKGNSSYYITSAGTVTNFSGSLQGEVTGVQSATVVSRIFGRPLSAAASSGTLSGGEVLYYNGTNWIYRQGSAGTMQSVTSANNYITVGGAPPSNNPTVDALLTINVGTTANTVAAGNDPRIVGALQASTPLGGDVTGLVSTTVVATVGGKTAAAIATSVNDTQSATANATANALVKRDGSGNVAVNTISSQNNSTHNLLLYNSGNTQYATISVPGSLGVSYALTLPYSQPVSGFVLGTQGNGQMLWVNPIAGAVTNVSATAPLSSTGGTTPVISIPQSNYAVDGYLSAVQFTNFSNKVASVTATAPITIGGTSQTPLIGLQNSGVTSGTYTKLTVDAKGIVTSGALLSATDIPDLDTSKITTGTFPVARGGTGSNSFLGNSFLTVNSGGTSFTGTVCAANELPFFNGLSWTCKTASSQNSSATLVMRDSNGDFTANNITTVQNMTVQANLRVQNGIAGSYIGLAAPIITPNYDITLPSNTMPPAAGQVLSVLTATGSAVTTTWVNALSDVLASGSIFVGNASGTAVGRALSGDATLSNTGALTLTDVGGNIASGAQYTKVTVDGKGRVVSGAQLSNSDVTAGLGYVPMNSVSSTAPITISGGASNPVIGLANSGVVSGAYGSNTLIPNFVVDPFGRITSATLTTYADATYVSKGIVQVGSNITVTTGVISVTSANIVAAMGSLGGDVSGTLDNTVVMSVGGKTAAQISQSVSDTINATSLNSSATIVRRDANGDFTANNITTVQDMTVQRNLRVQNGLTNYIGITAPIASPNYDIILPNNSVAPTVGQVLAVASGSTGTLIATRWLNALTDVLTSGTIFVGNASNVASGVPMTGDASISNTGNLQLSSVGAGVTSGVQYTKVTVDGKGRVTSGAQLNNADVVAGLGYVPMNSVSTTAPITLTGGASNPTIGLANSGVLAATYGSNTLVPFFTVDAFGRITSAGSQVYADATSGTKGIVQIGSNITVTTGVISVTSANIVAAMGSLGGDVSGTLSNTVVMTVGGRTSTEIADSVSLTQAATPNNSSGTIVRRDANGDFTANNITTVQDMTVQRNLRVQNGLTNYIGITAPIASPNYDIILPNNSVAPTVGQVLAVASGSTGTLIATRWLNALTDVLASGTIFVGNASDTASGVPMTGDATISNTGNLQLSSVGAGVTSGVQYTKVTVDGKGRVISGAQLSNSDVTAGLGYVPMNSVSTTAPITLTGGSSNPTIGLANSGVSATTYGSNTLIPFFTVDAFGRITSAGSQVYADATSGTKGIVQVGSNITVTTGVISITSANIVAAMGPLGGDVSGTLDNTVVMTVGGRTSTEIADSVSLTQSATPNNSSGTIVRRDAAGNFTANNITTVQDMTVQRNLRIQDGLVGNSIGLATPVALSANYNILLPDNSTPPVSGQVLGAFSGSSSTIGTRWFSVLHAGLTSGQIYVGNASHTATAVTVTGDAALGNDGNIQLSPVGAGVTSGSQYTKVTVDGKGRVTSATQLNYTDVTNALGYTPTNLVSVSSPMSITGGSSNPVISLNLSGVTSGVYPKVTVDQWGRVTSGTPLVNADIVYSLGYTPMNSVSVSSPLAMTGGASNPTIALSLSGVTSGVYPKVTVDQWGRVTSGTNLSFADITFGLGYTPMYFVSATAPILLSGPASSPIITLANSGVSSGSYGSSAGFPVFTVDTYGRVLSASTSVYADATSSTKGIVSIGQNITVTAGVISVTSGNIVAALGQIGGDVSGTLANTVVMTVGGRTSTEIADSVSLTQAATPNNSSGTIVRRDAAGNFTANNITTVQDMTVQRNLRVQDGSVGGYIGLTTPVGVANYDIVLPANGAPSIGQILGIASGTTSATIRTAWVSSLSDALGTAHMFVGSALGIATPRLMSGDATMNASGVLALADIGIVSGSQYAKVMVDGKGRVTSGAILLASDITTALGYTPTNLVSVSSPLAITGGSSNPVISLNLSGVTSGVYPKVTVDQWGRVTSGTPLTNADITFGLGFSPMNSVSSTSPITLTGGASNPIIGLALSGVVSGLYPKVTVDSWGRVTSGAALVFSDISTALGYTPVQLVSASLPIYLTGPASNPVVNLALSGVTSGVYPKVTVDAWGRVTSGTPLVNADIIYSLGYTPMNSVAVSTPLSISGGASNPVISLNLSGVTSGVYPKVTVDQWGRVTSGTNLSLSDVTTGLGYTPVQLVSATSPIVLTGPPANPVINLALSGVTSGVYPKVTVDAWGRVTSGTPLVNSDIIYSLGYTPMNSVAVSTPLSISGGASNPVISLNVSGITSGVYPKVTVDQWGRVTSGTNLAYSDISFALGYDPVRIVSSAAPITLTGTASNPVIGLANSGVTAGTYGSSFTHTVVSVDAFGRVTGLTSATSRIGDTQNPGALQVGSNITVTAGTISITSGNVIAAIGAGLSGDVTGSLSATVVSFVGGRTSTEVADSVSLTQNATPNNSSGTIVRRDAAGNFTANNITTVQDMTVQRNLRIQNGSSNYIGLTTPIATPSYDIILPPNNTPPIANQVLAVFSATPTLIQTTWVNALTDQLASGTILIGGTSGTAVRMVVNGDATLDSSGTLRLAYTGVTSATYGSSSTMAVVQVDNKGRVVSATSVPVQDGSASQKGFLQVGANLSVAGGVVSLTNPNINAALGYTPVASVTTTTPLTLTGTASNPVIGMANSGVTALTYGSSGTIPIITVDAFGRITSVTSQTPRVATSNTPGEVSVGTNITLSSSGHIGINYGNVISALTYTPLNKAGDTMSGTLNVSGSLVVMPDAFRTTTSQFVLNNGGVGIGTATNDANAILDLTSTNKALLVPRLTAASVAAISGTTAGYIAYNSTASSLQYFDGIWKTIATTSGAVTSINGIINQPGHWFTTGSAGTSFNVVSAGSGNHTFNFPMAATTGVTQGAITNTQYQSFVDKVTSVTGTAGEISVTGGVSTPTIALIATTVTAGTYGSSGTIPVFTVDSKGRITGVTSQTPRTATSVMPGEVSVGANIGVSASGAISVNYANIISALTFHPLNKAGDTMSGTLTVQPDGFRTTNAQFVLANGNVGIGTATPAYALDLQMFSTTSAAARIYNSSANGRGLIINVASNGIEEAFDVIRAGGTNIFRIQSNGGVGIGNSNVANNVILDVSATTKGVLIPRMTTAQVNALTGTDGLLTYNTSTNTIQVYDGSASMWKSFATTSGAVTALNGMSNPMQWFTTGSAGTSFNIVTNTGAGTHTFNIPMAATTGVTQGAITNTQYQSFVDKVTSVTGTAGEISVTGGVSTPTIALIATTVTAGTYGSSGTIPVFTVDSKGRITGVTSQTPRTATSVMPGEVSVGANIGVSASGAISVNYANIISALTFHPLNKAGDTMSGTLTVTNNGLATVDNTQFVLNNGGVGIGTNTNNTNAILDVTHTTKGVMLPRISSVNIAAIAAPTAGLLAYDSNINLFRYYNGAGWQNLATTSGAVTRLNGSSQTWQSFTTGSAGTSFNVVTNTGTGDHVFNIPMAATAGVTQGALSNTQYQTFTDKVTSVTGTAGQITVTGGVSTPTVGLATTTVAAGTYGSSFTHAVVTVDAYGRLTSVTSATSRIADYQNTGVVNIGTNITVSASGQISVTAANINAAMTSQSAKTFYAGPEVGTGLPSFRTIASTDLPVSGVAGAWVNGGNTMGVSAGFGTIDNQAIAIKTNNITRMSIETTGTVSFAGQAHSNLNPVGAIGAGSTPVDANLGNVITVSAGGGAAASATLALSNVRLGAAYTVVVSRGTASSIAQTSITCNGVPSVYVPANGARSLGGTGKTIYTFIWDGSVCLVTWITGF